MSHNAIGQSDKTAFTLIEAQEYAVKNNATVKNSLIDTKGKEKDLETTAIGLPQISAKGSYSYIPKVPEMSFGPYLDFSAIPDAQPVTGADLRSSYRQSPPIQLRSIILPWILPLASLFLAVHTLLGFRHPGLLGA
ncbi:MAG: hypothetical protein MZU79_02190 [Anaerotruncus sp.]|nr:hypothetical protein [Anaerotruncus sp.]